MSFTQRHFGKTLIRLTRQPAGRNLLDFCLATAATRSSVLLSTHLDRVIVITPHLSLSALPHNTSPSKRRTLLAVSMANELSYEAAASTNTHIPRVLDAFCKSETDQHQRVAHHLTLRISSRYTSFAPRTGRVERRGLENRTPLYWLATTVSPS